MKIDFVLTQLIVRLLLVGSICSIVALVFLQAVLSSRVVTDMIYLIGSEIQRFERWFE